MVCIRLFFPSHAAYLRACDAQRELEAAPVHSAGDGAAPRHRHRERAPPPRCSLLPWERHWELFGPQRMFGARASFHTSETAV